MSSIYSSCRSGFLEGHKFDAIVIEISRTREKPAKGSRPLYRPKMLCGKYFNSPMRNYSTHASVCVTLCHMKTISIRQLHEKTGEWVRKAERHGEIIITDRGEPIAKIIPEQKAS